jgi:hypothetical protein
MLRFAVIGGALIVTACGAPATEEPEASSSFAIERACTTERYLVIRRTPSCDDVPARGGTWRGSSAFARPIAHRCAYRWDTDQAAPPDEAALARVAVRERVAGATHAVFQSCVDGAGGVVEGTAAEERPSGTGPQEIQAGCTRCGTFVCTACATVVDDRLYVVVDPLRASKDLRIETTTGVFDVTASGQTFVAVPPAGFELPAGGLVTVRDVSR